MGGRLSELLASNEARVAVGAVAVIVLAMFLSTGVKEQTASTPTPDPSSGAPTDFEKMTGRPDPNAHSGEAVKYTEELARKSGGDWTKLSAEDQRYVNSLTAGHGSLYIKGRAKVLLAEDAKKKKAAGGKPTVAPTPGT